MSGTYPNSPRMASLTLESIMPSLQSTSHSGRRNVRQLGAQRWKLTGTYSNLTRDQFMPLYAFSISQDGMYGSFDLVPEDLSTPRGAASGTPVVNGASQSGKSLITSGWDPSITVLKEGDVFKLSTTNKVYMITSDCVSDGTGGCTLSFSPALTTSPADLEALVVANVPFKVQFDSNMVKYAAAKPLLYSFDVSFIEVL